MSQKNCIKELRERRGLSKTEFANKMGVSVQTVDDWEKDKSQRIVKACYFGQLSSLFNLPIEKIVWNDDKPITIALDEWGNCFERTDLFELRPF